MMSMLEKSSVTKEIVYEECECSIGWVKFVSQKRAFVCSRCGKVLMTELDRSMRFGDVEKVKRLLGD